MFAAARAKCGFCGWPPVRHLGSGGWVSDNLEKFTSLVIATRASAVLQIVLKRPGEVHRGHRHHHGVGAQDGEAGDDEVVAVLHVEQPPVAALHPADGLEVHREVFDVFCQFRITD